MHSRYATPLGDAEVDTDAIAALAATGAFERIPRDKEASEHSLEMHVPYILAVMKVRGIAIDDRAAGAREERGKQ